MVVTMQDLKISAMSLREDNQDDSSDYPSVR